MAWGTSALVISTIAYNGALLDTFMCRSVHEANVLAMRLGNGAMFWGP